MFALLLLCSCSGLLQPEQEARPSVGGGEEPLSFSAYTLRQTASTKAGMTELLTASSLQKTKGEGGGFGVFAYMSGEEAYARRARVPDFMYNQGIFYDGTATAWEYSPVKYWPNRTDDKISFFAYAPYVAADPATGTATTAQEDREWGVTGFSANLDKGDPLVRYKVGYTAAQSVDLCWADACKDRTRPAAVEDKVEFIFHHATALLNVRVDSYADETSAAADPEAGTRIYIRGISFTGFATEGALNLNNTTAGVPRWLSYDGSSRLVTGDRVTFPDGRRDGSEGMAGAVDPFETPLALNGALVESTAWADAAASPGVTATETALFANPAGLYVIPTGDPVEVTVVYDVETRSTNLAGTLSDGVTPGTTVRNSITKRVSFGTETGLSAGRQYILKLHLGLNSIKLDAEVEEMEMSFVWEFDFNGTTYDIDAAQGYRLAGLNGSVQTFTAPRTGRYKLEVWGAQGGDGFVCNATNYTPGTGGRGGYAYGEIDLTEGTELYVCVGGAGALVARSKKTRSQGGYNGGGGGGADTFDNNTPESASGGGGATHIARNTNLGVLSNYSANQDDVLIVAGGGGGSTAGFNQYDPHFLCPYCTGGGGGGTGRGLSTHVNAFGGPETGERYTGYPAEFPLLFGQGRDGLNGGETNYGGVGGGGGGWYGGYSRENSSTGGCIYPDNTNLYGHSLNTYNSDGLSGAGGSGHLNAALVNTGGADAVRSGNGFARIILGGAAVDLPD